jgi:hypothetical protein
MKRTRDRQASPGTRTETAYDHRGTIRMKRMLDTAGHQAHAAATRLHAGCSAVSYPWSLVDIRPTTNVMNEFADTSKATRRRKESSP